MMKRYRSRLLLLLCMLGAHSAHAQQELNVVSWDGAYVKSQILGFIRPYEEHANIRVNVLQYTGGIDEKIGRAHVNSSHVAISYAVFCLKKKKLKDSIY